MICGRTTLSIVFWKAVGPGSFEHFDFQSLMTEKKKILSFTSPLECYTRNVQTHCTSPKFFFTSGRSRIFTLCPCRLSVLHWLGPFDLHASTIMYHWLLDRQKEHCSLFGCGLKPFSEWCLKKKVTFFSGECLVT